jgi:hypothetical protein
VVEQYGARRQLRALAVARAAAVAGLVAVNLTAGTIAYSLCAILPNCVN